MPHRELPAGAAAAAQPLPGRAGGCGDSKTRVVFCRFSPVKALSGGPAAVVSVGPFLPALQLAGNVPLMGWSSLSERLSAQPIRLI